MKMKPKRNYLLNFIYFFIGVFLTILLIFIFKNKLGLFTTINSNGKCYTNCENKVIIRENSISDAVDKVYDSVVLVENYKDNKLISTGTGFVYKVDINKGYLLTNYHVIEGNTKINIVLSNNEEVVATYAGGDSYLDIAVLTIPRNKVLKVAEIGSSEKMNLGDTLFTIGTPVNKEYIGTVTRGILSGKDRLVSVYDSNNNQIVMKVLQTDAAMNPGNSGGPLVNINGEVIGINSLKLVEDEIEGMGFAITIEDIMSHIDSLEKGETIKRPYLGISMINVSDKATLKKANINVSDKIKEGVVIAEVIENATVINILEKGDVIVAINDEEIKNAAYLKYELYKYKIGEKVVIKFIRNNKTYTKEIVLKGIN